MTVGIWMPLYIGDHLSTTTRLTTEQHGAYLLLQMDYWKNGPPPDDDAVLAQITRMPPDAWRNARATLAEYIEVEDGLWKQARLDSELQRARENKEATSARATNAADARWEREALRNAQALLEECPSPSTSSSESRKRNFRGQSRTKLPKDFFPDPKGLQLADV